MHRIFLLFITLLVFTLPVAAFAGSSRPQGAPGGGSLVGQVAPEINLETLKGERVVLSQLKGKVVVVNFWATWCPPCRAEMPSMERLYARFKGQGLEMLAVNVEADAKEILPGFFQKHPHTFQVLLDLDGDSQTAYGVFRFPESFVIGKDGKVVDHIIGGRDWSDKNMVARFSKLLGG
jgi:thiol-disulfide isomerase/thioredoxin